MMTTRVIPSTDDNRRDAAIPSAVRDQYTRMFDSLTALPNWALLIDRTHVALQRARRHSLLAAVVVLSDVRRAAAASPNLAAFVSVLRMSVHGDDTVSRIDGCTFVIVLNDVTDRDAVLATSRALIERSGIACHVGVALGASPRHAVEVINEALDDAAPPPPPAATPWWEGSTSFAPDPPTGA